ncbi:MAG: flagellar motor switch protein FliG [Bauldia sp.]
MTAEAPATARSRQHRPLKGAERAAVLLLSLGQEHAAGILKALDETEVRDISLAMARLGQVSPQMIEELMVEFASRISARNGLTGNIDATERLLVSLLPSDRANAIMTEIRGPAGRNMWEKLSNVPETVLANYLKNEYPQTVAVVLSKVKQDHAARVLAALPEEFAFEVVGRMLRMEAVQKEVLEKLEQTLRTEFMSTLAHTTRRDSHEQMADIFNNFDRQTEARFMAALEELSRESADRIKALMFTFDDLSKLDSGSVQTLLRSVDKDKLAVALKGTNETVREFFLSNMSQRAAAMLREDIDAKGPVRLREVDEAQGMMVALAKDLAAKGEIMISKNKGDDELVY